MNSIEPMSISLATGSKVVRVLMCTIPIVSCYVGGNAITQYVPCQIINNLQYNIVFGMDWLKSPNPVIYWVVFSLELTVGAK